MTETFPCPNCGAELKANAQFCRECGSDNSTGWSENTLYDGLDLPDTIGQYQEPIKPKSRLLTQIVLIFLIIAFIMFIIR